MIPFFPKKFANQAIVAYVIGLVLCSVIFHKAVLPLWLMAFGLVSVYAFFTFSNRLTMRWLALPASAFGKRLFSIAFIIRIVYVIFIYYFNNSHYGTFTESSGGDIGFYVSMGEDCARYIRNESWNVFSYLHDVQGLDMSDMGYIIYLSVVYFLTGSVSTVIIPLILKSAIGAWTCVLTYRIARRHFGERAAMMTGIFCMLQANLVWWCGSMMKETEMVFILMQYMDIADGMLQGEYKNQLNWIAVTLLGLILFTFRSALAMVSFAALYAALVFTSSRVVSWGKKIIAAVLVCVVALVSYGESIKDEIDEVTSVAQSDSYQQINMNWRTEREHGNSFASYAGKAVFAPLIFTIPFPTVNYTYENQEMQVMVSGGNFEKNVLSFFVILILFTMLIKGEWRHHVFLISLLCGYMCALAMSVFAQSGRFHVPAIPLELMLAAYGITKLKIKQIKWFQYVLMLEIVIMVAWGWFKLKGQGLI